MLGEWVMGIASCRCSSRSRTRQQPLKKQITSVREKKQYHCKSITAKSELVTESVIRYTVVVLGYTIEIVVFVTATEMDDHLLVNHTGGVFNATTLSDTVWSSSDPTSAVILNGVLVASTSDHNSTTITVGPVTDTNVTDIVNDVSVTSSLSCGEWEPAQHNLYQLSNICFAAAFCMPRSFKPSILILRTLLCFGFLISVVWAGVHICSPDVFAWNLILSLTNLVHSAILTCRFLPPALSVELTDLYIRLFKPLRVTKKHFKELTKEASMYHLARGENYAIEESTPADERLSILLKGKLRVTCDNMHLHYINSHQFIDSPEWEASHETSDELFQVTITAEEDCIYLSWPKLRLDRVLRHRPMLHTILSSLIGKDITQKLYSLNEQLGSSVTAADFTKASHTSDHWRHVMTRSLSVDAVDTGTKGHVRSHAYRTSKKDDRRSSDCESPPSHGQQCWIPVVASHFPATSPFVASAQQAAPTSHSSYAPPPPPCLPGAATSAAMSATAQQPPVALIPVIVPIIAPPPAGGVPGRPNRPRPREVTFDESKV